ncbi:hypothetical protein HK098_000533 [Nowakowskiella sp. JEL0407]|nr:hypothetical protein HK098_000533 [Nowakowskiella sp. JEL0407]
MDDRRRGELVLKASLCCLDLLTKLGTYDIDIPGNETKSLRIHLGIGAGKIYDVHVGDAGRWEHFVASDAVNQLAHVLDLAKSGELAMSHQALKWFGVVMDIGTVTIGSYDKRCIILSGLENARRKVPPPTPTDLDDLALWEIQVGALNNEFYKRFIAKSALFKLQADINQSRLFQLESSLMELMSLSELRQVTTLFIRIGSLLNWETTDVLTDAQAAMKIVQKALSKYEGSLRQFHVDDKGASILVFFGLPPLAHENDAIYGIKAAIEIMEGFKEMFDEFSIGVTTGVVSIGGVGNAIRTEYAVMGDSINMAARLMFLPACQTSILCDEASYNLTEREFVFEKLGEAKVKGKSRPILIFKPKAIIPESSKPNRAKVDGIELVMLGRNAEKAAIEDTLVNLVARKESLTKIVLMQAEGGQGLSSLVKYTQIKSQKHDCFSCLGSAAEMERSTPLYVFRDIICDLLAWIDDADLIDGKLQLKFQTPQSPQPPTSPPPPVIVEMPDIPKINIVSSSSSSSNSMEGQRFLGVQTLTPSKSLALSPPSLSLQKSKSKNFLPLLKNNDKSDRTNGLVSPPPEKSPLHGNSFQPPMNTYPAVKLGEPSKFIPINMANINEERVSFSKLRDKYMSAQISNETSIEDKKIITSELEARITCILNRVNETTKSLPLFNLIMPFDFLEEGGPQIQGKIRIKELQELIRRIINFVAENNSLVLIFHETQWMDILSWELLWDIIHNCTNVVVYIFSRPLRYYESEDTRTYLTKIKRTTNVVLLNIEGLNKKETGELIVQTWHGSTVKSVSSKIVESVYKRTSGNPLFVKSLVTALKESGNWRISEQGELLSENGDFDFDHATLGNDLHSIIVAQFDRHDRYFQLFLKVASVLGQRFLLDDVLYFLSDMTGFSDRFDRRNISSLLRTIEHMDKYGYLQRLDGEQDGQFFQFKSAVVRKGIYSMMVKSQRQHLHLSIATYYEKVLNETNRHRLLIPLYEHYIETDDRHNRKKLFYLELVSHFYFEKNAMADAIKHYKLLLNTVELLQDVHGLQLYKNSQMANWHRELGEAYFSRMEIDKAECHLLESLKLSGHPFPVGSFRISWEIRKERSIRSRYSVSGHGDSFKNLKNEDAEILLNPTSKVVGTSGNALSEKVLVVDLESMKNWTGAKSSANVINTTTSRTSPSITNESKEELFLVRLVLLTLSQIYVIKEKSKHHKYAVMRGLNISEKFSKDSVYAKFLALAGSSFWTMENRRSAALRYLDAAERHDRRSDPNASASIISCQAQTLFLMGSWDTALVRYDLLQQLGSITGDFKVIEEALRLKNIITIQKFSVANAITLSKLLLTSATQEENWLGKFWGSYLLISCLLATDDINAIRDPEIVLREMWTSEQAERYKNAAVQICYHVVLAEADFRRGMQFSIPKFFAEMSIALKGLKVQHWMAVLGLLHILSMLNDSYYNNKLDVENTQIINFCKGAISALDKMEVFCMSRTVRYLFKGLKSLFMSKPKDAIRQFNKALEQPICENLIFLRGQINLAIARCSTGKERTEKLVEANFLLEKIGATHDLQEILEYMKK